MKYILLILILNPYIIKCFEEILIEISMDEEQENGTLVVDLRSKISSLSLLNNSEGYEIKFVGRCLNLYFDKKNLFKILSLKIDREEICPYENNCYLNCNLFLEKEEIKLIKLKININDINDHKPKFNKKSYLFEILNENLIKNNFNIQLEEAEDKDLSKENSIQNYYLNLLNENEFPFKLNFNKNNHLLQLILINNIKEKKKKFLIELIVIDGQNLKDNCFIEINILENEQNLFNPPEFYLKLYQFFIFNQNQTFIGQVNVINPFNKQIYYRLISSNYLNLFQINQTTGEIYFFFKNNQQQISSFNYFYELFIEAYYLNYISSLTTVHIYFNFTYQSNLNQENFIQILIPKLFQKNLNQNQIYLKENSSIPLTILQLFISSSSLKLEMKTSINKNYFYLKQLDQQSFELILLKSIDYELIQNISLDFILNLTIKSIEIIILNINDSPPSFNQTQFFLQIQENNQFPFLIQTFQAFDQDYLNPIIYEIQTKDNEQIFSINSTNGELWILKSFDREIKSNYTLLICAFDQIYRSCSEINLEILDENDNICKFNSTLITLTINENLLSNINLIQIQAFDSDYKENGTLYYSFLSKTEYLNINSLTGLIKTTTKSFDYEFIQTYSLIINVCDNINSFPSLCCSIQLFIYINDINDNLPFLIYPLLINDLFIINYINKTMPSLKAFDNDIYNPIIFFNIIGGSINSFINIDYYSGQLYLLSSSILPLYGTLIISISFQTNITLTILIYDNQTNLQTYLISFQQSSSFFKSYQLFYFISFITLLLLIIIISLIFYFFKQKKQKSKQDDDPLMNTPSTTTLSARSLSSNKKLYETYYSFGDSVLSPQVIHL